ncbi:hypothetical protein FGO68_gene8861 [Halteria grandinella]|uniref:Uncharacterized protein n=1 Tax=Halteria grandinella TaxID=5974 RepID=A0A8J8NSV4_HALGN|nr:hypothetical protein FGO68_gene8861 [Halteria grandinella]
MFKQWLVYKYLQNKSFYLLAGALAFRIWCDRDLFALCAGTCSRMTKSFCQKARSLRFLTRLSVIGQLRINSCWCQKGVRNC